MGSFDDLMEALKGVSGSTENRSAKEKVDKVQEKLREMQAYEAKYNKMATDAKEAAAALKKFALESGISECAFWPMIKKEAILKILKKTITLNEELDYVYRSGLQFSQEVRDQEQSLLKMQGELLENFDEEKGEIN